MLFNSIIECIDRIKMVRVAHMLTGFLNYEGFSTQADLEVV